MAKFTYLATSEKGKPTAFATKPFHVVHVKDDGKATSTVEAFNDEVSAGDDAKARNQRAADFGLSCTYKVFPREDGEGVAYTQ